MQNVSVTEARVRFSKLVEQVRSGGEAVQITKNGEPTAVILSLTQLAQITRWQKEQMAQRVAELAKPE